MADIGITGYHPRWRQAVLDLTLAAWGPVFPRMRDAVPGFVYDAFYPRGWEARQVADVGALLDAAPERFRCAREGDTLAGFAGIALHPEDRMGEIVILAVAPEFQRRGIGRALMDDAEARIRAAGMEMVMVETVDDPGHAPARAHYEGRGYERWPVARYFKRL